MRTKKAASGGPKMRKADTKPLRDLSKVPPTVYRTDQTGPPCGASRPQLTNRGATPNVHDGRAKTKTENSGEKKNRALGFFPAKDAPWVNLRNGNFSQVAGKKSRAFLPVKKTDSVFLSGKNAHWVNLRDGNFG